MSVHKFERFAKVLCDLPSIGLDNVARVGKIPTRMKNLPIGCLSIHDAEERMRHCLKIGAVIPGKHFREELTNAGINLQDAWIVLRYGHIYDAPEKDIKTGEWKYRMEGPEPDGKWTVIVFSINTVDTAFLITVFTVEHRGRERK
jgi:hypothetical protein